MNYEIVLATNNKHKLEEFRRILAPHGIVLYGLQDLNIVVNEVEENGSSYFQNALLKAENVAKITSFPVIADDTGLEIEALDNGPGLFTARYAEKLGGYDLAFEEIFQKISSKKNNKAKFICSLAVLNIEKNPLRFEGVVEGTITNKKEGLSGFGYDPIFIPSGKDITYAQMDEKEKDSCSHRGKALLKFLTYLRINRLINK